MSSGRLPIGHCMTRPLPAPHVWSQDWIPYEDAQSGWRERDIVI